MNHTTTTFQQQSSVRHGIRSVGLLNLFELDYLLSNEVNLRSGSQSALHNLLVNVTKPYYDVITRVDEVMHKV
jgi:hypothetical protein